MALKSLAPVISIAVLLLGCSPSEPLLTVLDGVEVQYVMTLAVAGAVSDHIGPDFEVMDSGTIIVRGENALIALDARNGSMEATTLQSTTPPPDSFAVDQGPTMLVIRDRFLGLLEETGYSQAIGLPADNMSLASSNNPGTVYLYGSVGNDSYRLYAFYEDGVLDVLLDLPVPIVGVADNRHAIYVATAHEIVRIDRRKVSLVLRLSNSEPSIISIAASDDDGTIYFSTANRVTAFSGLAGIPIVTNAGGTLRMRDSKLYVFDSQRNILAILSGMDQALRRKG